VPTGPTAVDSIKKFSYETMIGVVNKVRGPGTEDQFESNGSITPDQFVAAGDMLTTKCRTWTWESGDPSKAFSYLPPEKQFLMTRRVPCLRRAREVEGFEAEEVVLDGGDVDDGWAMTISDEKQAAGDEEVPDLDDVPDIEPDPPAEGDDDSDDIPDLDDFDDDNLVVEPDAAAMAASASDTIMKTRTYDMYITYDQYHQTPKVYLQGYDEAGDLLTPEQTFEDIASDYVHKTVSIETHPHLPIVTAFIHPCRHAEVMQRLLTMMKEHNGTAIRADQCMFLFLKFISSVVPTIQYDFTTTIDM